MSPNPGQMRGPQRNGSVCQERLWLSCQNPGPSLEAATAVRWEGRAHQGDGQGCGQPRGGQGPVPSLVGQGYVPWGPVGTAEHQADWIRAHPGVLIELTL